MIFRFYPKKDSTVYEQHVSRNTGMDAILEVSKTVDSTNSYNSRILLDYDYTAISQSIVDAGFNPNLFDWRLKLYTVEAKEIPLDYDLECYAVSQSWGMGVGRYSNLPETTVGVSWKYRLSASETATSWSTSSFANGSTGSWSENPGGGTWYTGSASSQSFSYSTTDVDLNVNGIVRLIQSGSINFQGFLIKRNNTDENSTLEFGSLKFFSKDSHTVYFPALEARYDDSIQTGSLSEVVTDGEFNIVAVNLQEDYKESSTPKIRFSARPRFIPPAFTTSSTYLTRYKLPAGSQYAVYNVQSDDVILNFGNYTKLSSDDQGSYFSLPLESFQPERYYKILLKVPYSGSNAYQIFDNDWIFKVSRNQ
jgi:hypothetical protein